jgi:AhpD family alkylhydroperoxidase
MSKNKIDPALDLMKEFSKVTHGTVQNINQMRQKAIFTDGEVPSKFKILAAMVWSISARCEPCFKYYVVQAKEKGVTEEELGEFLAVASTMGGCVGEMWALKAYAAYKLDGGSPSESPTCCE